MKAMLFGLVVFTVAAVAISAQASVTVTATEVDGDVVFEGSGTLNLDGWSFISNGTGGSRVNPVEGVVVVGQTTVHGTWGIVGGISSFNEIPSSGFGNINLTSSGSGSGDHFGFSNLTSLVLPSDYVSGDPLSGSATYARETIASLGMVPGTYVWSWGTGQPGESFTLIVDDTVPTRPRTWGRIKALYK